MRKSFVLLAALFLVGLFTATVFAGDAKETNTYEGKLICAKCSLKEEGREKCQNVLLVDEAGNTTLLYLAKNEVSDEFGHVCQEEKRVRVTGSVEEKEGKKWLTASKINHVKAEG